MLGELPYSEKVRESDLKHFSPCDADGDFKKAITGIAEKLRKYAGKKPELIPKNRKE